MQPETSSISDETKVSASVWESLSNEDKRRAKSHWLGFGRYVNKDDWLAIGRQSAKRFSFLERILDRSLPAGPDVVMLEWGPGGGSNAVGLGDRCGTYIGIDISQSNLAECARQVAEAGVRAEFRPVLIKGQPSIQLPEENLPKVDLFLSTAVFQHFPSKPYTYDVLRALHSQTAPRAAGFIQIRFDNDNPKFKTIDDLSDYKSNYTTACSFRIDDFYTELLRHGFRILSINDIRVSNNYATFFVERI